MNRALTRTLLALVAALFVAGGCSLFNKDYDVRVCECDEDCFCAIDCECDPDCAEFDENWECSCDDLDTCDEDCECDQECRPPDWCEDYTGEEDKCPCDDTDICKDRRCVCDPECED